jgi:hypothetical protein
VFFVRCVAPGTLAALSDDAARGGRAGSSADTHESASASATAFIVRARLGWLRSDACELCRSRGALMTLFHSTDAEL